jgi:hypothetical protein
MNERHDDDHQSSEVETLHKEEWNLEHIGNYDPVTRSLVVCHYLNDNDAMLLGSSLARNTSLEFVTIGVGITCMSNVGARAVTDGIRQSQVQKLRLHATELGRSDDVSGIRHFLHFDSQHNIRELMLDVVDLCEEDLIQLATTLRESNSLCKLEFILESGCSEQGIEALAVGLENSHLTCLRLSLQTNISELREIIYGGIQRNKTLQRLEIESEFDEWNSVADIGELYGILSSLPSLNVI